MSQGNSAPSTCIRVRWGKHQALLDHWKQEPPAHPQNPRYRAFEFEVEGRYSLVESVVNVFRARGWLDAPPADYKWAVLTVRYRAPADRMDGFATLSRPKRFA